MSQERTPNYTQARRFFMAYWPIVLFGSFFVLMLSIPIILSGLFAAADPFSSSDVVQSSYGLLLIGFFLVALLIAFALPRFLNLYVFAVGIYALILAEGATATNWGIWIALLFLTYMLAGHFYLPQNVKASESVDSDDDDLH